MEKDIHVHIIKHYPLVNQQEEVVFLLDSIKRENINVEVIQLQRAILKIAKGDINVIKDILDQNFYNDPRDVIMMGIENGLNNSGMSPLEK